MDTFRVQNASFAYLHDNTFATTIKMDNVTYYRQGSLQHRTLTANTEVDNTNTRSMHTHKSLSINVNTLDNFC